MTFSYRRAYARFPLESSAEINAGKAKGIISMLTDISAGGAGVVTSIPFEAFEKIDIFTSGFPKPRIKRVSFIIKNISAKKNITGSCIFMALNDCSCLKRLPITKFTSENPSRRFCFKIGFDRA